MKNELPSNGTVVPAKPAGTAPRPPRGYTPPDGRVNGAIATAQQERDALDVAREVTTSKSYEQDFTSRAPPSVTFAAELTTARAWSDELAAAEAWSAYVRVQRDLAWQATLATARKLKPEFELALKHDGVIGERYPQTRAFLAVWKAAAAKAVETKAAQKKAKAEKKPDGK
jgi:hypothetical protein